MEITECNKCGKCKEVCPSYKLFLNESFSPRGRIEIFQNFRVGKLTENKILNNRIYSCLLCGACFASCPLRVNVPSLIYGIREQLSKNLILSLFKYFSLYPDVFFSVLRYLYKSKFALNLLKKQKIIPFSLTDKLSKFDIKPSNNKLQIFSKSKAKGRFALFIGCSTKFLMPSIRDVLVDLLLSANFEVLIPSQHCCGAPLLSAGYKEETIKLAKKNVHTYKSFHIDGVITPCPTCAHFIGSVYEDLIHEKIKILKVSDIIGEFELKSKNFSYKRIFLHSSCHSSNYIGDTDAIVKFLCDLGIPVEKKDGCCGFGGLFSFLFEKESMDITRKKVLEYEKADLVLSSCPNCIIQLKSALKEKNIEHYLEFLYKLM